MQRFASACNGSHAFQADAMQSQGRPAKTPDGSVLIAWTPDPVWLADKIADTDGDGVAIGKLIDEAAKRPEKPAPRPKHKTHVQEFRK